MIINSEPGQVFKFFEEICAIPHGSGNTKRISDYLVDFAKSRSLNVVQDGMNNVIITKPATTDKMTSEPVILQGHMDMVTVKEEWCDKNLETEGIEPEVDGDYISAKGTSLGADDGIAVAYMLALLDSVDISHPELICIITVDEEIGMLGATGLDLSKIKAKIMMNMDSEDEGVFLLSCAGGATVECEIAGGKEECEGYLYKVRFSGFKGGHSGVEINKGRANANVIFIRFLRELAKRIHFGIISFTGGEKDNAISKIVDSKLVIKTEDSGTFNAFAEEFAETIRHEFSGIESELSISVVEEQKGIYHVMNKELFDKMLITAVVPNGVQAMSGCIEGLVQTSLNLGIMKYESDSFKLTYSVRSSVGSQKNALIDDITGLIDSLGGKTVVSGSYPAWEYKEESRLRDVMTESYKRLFGETPKYEAIHAGVECGIMADKIEDLDCVSFGPQMYDIHTVNERLSIESTKRTWKLITDVLKNI